MSGKEKLSEELLLEEEVLKQNEIILYNDDVNTFDHVINTLVKVCRHSVEQAEQCALLIHYKGKCTVKHGSFPELRPMCEAILDAGITATIM